MHKVLGLLALLLIVFAYKDIANADYMFMGICIGLCGFMSGGNTYDRT